MALEDELFKRLRGGDDTALDELIRLYYPNILRYCLWHTESRQAAEDATQETFLKAVRHMDGYTHQGKFKAYLYKIAANTCTDLYRQSGRRELAQPEEYIEVGFERVEAEYDLMRALKVLPDEQREVVMLRYVHELKLREIADILGEPPRTVQSRLRAALAALKKAILKGEPSWADHLNGR